MLNQTSIQSIIEERIPFRYISTGWYVGKCALCNDYKERAGFKFENSKCSYHCWNCSKASNYEEFSGKISRNFRSVLNSYGLDDSEINSIVNIVFFNKKEIDEKVVKLSTLMKVNTSTPTIKLPEKIFKLGHIEFLDYQHKLISYLLNRKIDIDKYQFFFSLDQKFLDRIIVPFYRNNNLIYWQARSVNNNEKLRYLNAPVSREAVMFNFNQIYKHSNVPLFVTEGVFDAMMIDGIALVGSSVNEAKKKLLSATCRRLVFVIDKDSNGAQLADNVLKNGWEISFSPEGSKDLNHSVSRFGHSWTIYELMKSVCSDGDKARFLINFHCGKSNARTQRSFSTSTRYSARSLSR